MQQILNFKSSYDINITSGLDTNIIASNLSGTGSGSIISGGDTNIFNAVDTSYSYSQSSETRTGLIRQLPIYGEMISVLSTVLSVNLSTINGLTGGNLETIQRANGTEYSKSNLANSSTTEKLVASNLNFGNNLTIGSNVDITVKASNLTTTSGDILLAANGDVNILSAAETSTTNRNYRDKSDRAKERGNTDNTEIKNISSTVTSGSDLSIISGNDTTIQSSKLSSGDNLTVDAGNNLLLVTAKDVAIKNEENKGRTAYAFSNGTSGYVDVKAVNNEITSNTNSTVNSNLSLNAANSILAQYRAGTMEDVISGANTSNQQLAYLKTVNDLAQADPSKVTLDPIADMMKDWDQTTRGLTGAGQAVIVVAAVAIAIGTGGIGSGISGAMMTAVATTAGTTATISATNASMNTDSSVWGSTKSISSDAWRNTTSDESIRNMAIAAAVAGAASWAVEASGGTATVEKGKDYAVYKPDPQEMIKNPEYRAFVETNYPNYNGVIDPSANNIGIANAAPKPELIGTPVDYSKMTPIQKVVNEGGIISNGANQVGGMNAMSVSHDGWGQNFIVGKAPVLQISIIPAIAVEYCAISPAACAAVTSKLINNNFGVKNDK